MFGEFLYQISGRDEQLSWLDLVLFEQNVAAAAGSVLSSGNAVPERNIMVMRSACVECTGGGAQLTTGVALLLINPSASRNHIVAASYEINFQSHALNWSGELYIPPGWLVRAQGTFNAGVALNTTRLNYNGVQLPLGNVQRS